MDRIVILNEFEKKIGVPISEQDVSNFSDDRRIVFYELLERGCIRKKREETQIYETVSSNKNAQKTTRDYYYIDEDKFQGYLNSLSSDAKMRDEKKSD